MKFERTNLVGGSIKELILPSSESNKPGALHVAGSRLNHIERDGTSALLPYRPTKLYDFHSHTFSNAGANGRFGPTVQQCLAAYSDAEWAKESELFNVEDGIQVWTVPDNGIYRITAFGAEGGGPTANSNQEYGGNGAKMQGDFYLKSGTKLRLLVGQIGSGGSYSSTGGGGGSFVFLNEGKELSDLLIVAGGGGGGGNSHNEHGADAPVTENGTAGIGTINGEGGIDGHGGKSVANAGGGAGFFSDGEYPDNRDITAAALSLSNGGYGGKGNSEGGFGGGGSATLTSGRRKAGGGGGFSGGGGSVSSGATNQRARGGGGGSYNKGEKQVNESGENAGNGTVTIYRL